MYVPPFEYREITRAPGIYVIINSVNNHKYVGQSVNLKRRRHDHFSKLAKGCHDNAYLQNAYNLYGRSNFVFCVVHYVDTEDDLNFYEQYWIERLKPEYNVQQNVFENAMWKRRSHDDPLVIRQGESFKRPAWHAWVYGGGRNPALDGRRNGSKKALK